MAALGDSHRRRLVVVGHGMAGARLIEQMRADRCAHLELTVLGDEPRGGYNRVLLSELLAGQLASEDSLFDRHAPGDGVRFRQGMRVTAVDCVRRVVHGEAGVEEPYDILVLATGSAPFVPPVPGLREADGRLARDVFVLRTLADCRAILDRTRTAEAAAVIGGGLLGLEAARGLLQLGLEVHVVDIAERVMEAQLDATAAALLARRLEEVGLILHLAKGTVAAASDAGKVRLTFANGTDLVVDLVVVCAGIRPNVELARAAGLVVKRGIVVGDDLRCEGQDDVYAVGECAEHNGETIGLVAPLFEQVDVLADRLTGRRPEARYLGSRVSTKLKVAGVDLAVMGVKEPVSPMDEEVTYVEPARGVYKKLIVRSGRLVGAIVLGDGATAASLARTFRTGAELPDDRAELLFTLAPTTVRVGVESLPDEAQICACHGVSKGRILEAVRGACRSLKAIGDATGAGTGCGGCRRDLQALLDLGVGGAVVEDPSVDWYVPDIPLAKPDLVRTVRERGLKSVSAVFAALGSGRSEAASKPALASLLRIVWGGEYVDERDARFVNDRVHANIQRDGTFSVVPRIYGGVVTPAQLRRIADVAEKQRVPMVKLTGGQRIDLLGVPRERLPDVWGDLGMPSGHAYTKALRTCKTCVGSRFCRYGLGDSISLGIEIERRFQGVEAPAKLKLAVAGCPRNCSEATTKDMGVVAQDAGRWEIRVGGAAGTRVREGDVLAVVDGPADAIRLCGRFLQDYRECARYAERTCDFVERVGIGQVRDVVVHDRAGTAAALDSAMDAAVRAFVDPWQEGRTPVHPAQFRTELEARALPARPAGRLRTAARRRP